MGEDAGLLLLVEAAVADAAGELAAEAEALAAAGGAGLGLLVRAGGVREERAEAAELRGLEVVLGVDLGGEEDIELVAIPLHAFEMEFEALRLIEQGPPPAEDR